MLRFGGFADRSLTNEDLGSSAEFRASLVLPPTRFDLHEMGSLSGEESGWVKWLIDREFRARVFSLS